MKQKTMHRIVVISIFVFLLVSFSVNVQADNEPAHSPRLAVKQPSPSNSHRLISPSRSSEGQNSPVKSPQKSSIAAPMKSPVLSPSIESPSKSPDFTPAASPVTSSTIASPSKSPVSTPETSPASPPTMIPVKSPISAPSMSPTALTESPATTPVFADAPDLSETSPVTSPHIPSTPANAPDIFPYGRSPTNSSAPVIANIAPETAEAPAGEKSASKYVQHDLLYSLLILGPQWFYRQTY